MALPQPMNHMLRAGVQILLRGENGEKQWMGPNDSRYAVSHVETFMNRYTSLSRVYRDYDEALLNSRDNARWMLNDIGVRECLDARKRMVALLNWHIQPEDDKSHEQKEFCDFIEKIVRRIKHFTEYRYAMQDAIWYGKAGISHRWRAEVINGQSVWMPRGIHTDDWGWRPLNGDKIVFRQSRPAMVPGAYEGQMGIRVGWMDHKAGDVINGRWRIEATDYGLAYFLSPIERQELMLIHKHHPVDASYEDGIRAGSIHGVGIRSVIYAEWVQKQETQAFMMEFLERMAGGIHMWKYPQGNVQALNEMREAAENYNSGKEHIMLVPVPMGENANQYGVDVVEPGFQGIETIQHLIKDYFNDRVKRYILGQKLSSEAEATGLGSGVAELHMDTLLQIIKSDATSNEETLTDELIASIIRVNVKRKTIAEPNFRPRFVNETEESDVDKKGENVRAFMQLGVRFRLKDIYDLTGMAQPGPNDELTPEAPGKGGDQPGLPGMGGGLPGQEKPAEPTAGPSEDTPDGPPQKPGDKEKDKSEPRDDNAAHGHSERHLQRYSAEVN